MGDLAVNTEARLWGPYKELEKTINAAIHKKIPDAVHDLEVALKQHKPNFISLLKNPAKGTLYRDAVKKSVTAGLQVQGEQATQTFSSQFIEEALIISDLFDMNEIAAVELLMAGERKQSEFPGLSRGLVAVLLYYDGQRSLVNALRTLLQSREGRTWTMELTPDLANIVTQFTDQLITKDGIINKILDLISNMDWINEMDKLQAERAIGPPKHRKQVTDIYKEIKLILADCLFCLACQQPLDKTNTKRLISHLRSAVADTANGVLDLVNLSLTMTLLYCFDVSVLEQEDASDTIKNLPFIKDTTYVPEIHQEITSPLPWATSGIQALVRFAWGLVLRQLSQYQVPTGYNEILEDEEVVIDMALETNVFHFLHTSVVAVPEFHSEEFYLRRLHGMITDFISNMPLKVKELRNRGDEIARVMISQNVDLLDTSVTAQKGFEYLLRMIGDMYKDDPLGLGLSMEYWGPSETQLAHETTYNYRPPQKQGMQKEFYDGRDGNCDPPKHAAIFEKVTLYKFVRSAGDLLPAALYLPYIYMLRGLSANQQSAQSCFDLLKLNGISTGPATSVSWNHIFHSLTQYYEELRREAPTNSESSQHSRAPPLRGITAIELEGLIAVLRLTRVIAEKNEICRVYLFENQQWSCIMVLFGLITCSVPQSLKAELFLTLAAFAKSHDIAAALWQTLEASQILPTVSGSKLGGIHVELDEIESRNEEYPMLRGFLQLMNALTDIPVPAGLGAGLRAPGFDPYLFFLKDNVFQRFSSRGYKNPEEKWEVASSVLNILVKLLKEHEVAAEDFIDEVVELQSGGTTTLNKNPGHTLLIYMLNDSNFLKMVLRIIDEAINQLELYTDFPGKSAMEKAALQSLKMIEYSLEKADTFATLCRETGASVMIVSMDRLLLGINTRTGKPDHLVNIAKYVTFGTLLPFHTQSAMKILLKICQSAPVQSEMLNLFTVDSATKLELLNGFVECLEVDCVETHVPDNIIFQGKEEPEEDTNHVRNLTRQNLLHILLHAIEQPGTNLAHFLLGFELRKPVSKTNLQDPGILGSPRTCLHAILNLLEQGVDTPSGPTCLLEIPTLAELCYKLIYLLCANKDTSIPTLRYLRTTRDFLCKQLQHLPFSQKQHVYPVGSHQSWLLYTVAVELRITSLNRQRSYTQRVIRLLLDDNLDADEMTSMGMGDEETAIFDRMGDSSFFQSAFGRRQTHLKGKQNRRKLLSLLDAIEFSQKYPEPLALEIFEPERIEKVIQATEKKGPDGVVYCNVQQLHKILTMELNSHQGTVVASQRQRILQEVSGVLRNVVARNKVRRSLHTKQRAFDAWRQVAEILLTACPEDHLTKDNRRQILFELLHDLLQKVSDDNTLTELTAPVAGSILTLTANLCQSFTAHAASSHQSPDTSAGQGQNVAWGEGSMSGSRTLHATSLQLVLKGLVEYMMKSSGGLQRVRANLYGSLLYYLQIAQKPKSSPETFVPEDEVGGGVGNRVLASSDSEYELLCKENVNTLLAYGDSFMDMVCRDACDGHDVGRMLALSVMDTILSMDKFQQWMTFMSGKGYLQHLVDSLLHDDAELQTLMSSSPELRVLYIYESKMSLLTRVAESAVGAHTLLRCGVMQRLAACSFFDMRPDLDRSREVSFLMASEDFLPSPMARYQQVLFASLKLCLAVLTSLGIENQDAGNQVLQFIFAHGEVFHNILRDRQPSLNIQALKELALTTAVISRANYKGLPDVEFDGLETASIEFRAHKTRIERQMIALMPRYCFSEKLIKQLRNTEHQDLGNGQDLRAEMSLAYQEIAANVTSFCRSVVSTSGYTSQFCRVLFGPSLEEALARDIRSTDELSFSMGPSQTPNLGIVVFQLRQCTNQFMSVYDAHQTHLRKLQSVTDLSTEDLKEFAGVSATEKVSSHQKQLLARKRLSQIVHYKGKELKYLSYIIENCLFVLWRHLEFYLLHCIPVDQQPSLYQAQIRRQHQLRRLQDITGASSTSLNESGFGNETELDEVSRGVTREEIANLKQTAMSAITESMLKKLQEINQSFCQNRTHFGFVEALIRRTKRLLRLHTSS